MPWQSPISPGISWYEASVGERPEYAPLDGSVDTDVAIVGGGFTGLSTALHLAERGILATLIEAAEPGWGASGRNGGQVNPGVKLDEAALSARHGPTNGNVRSRSAASTGQRNRRSASNSPITT